jgi:hypothetical protein
MNKKENIDLLYLTNQNFVGKYDQKKQISENLKQFNEDMSFYRKRIFSATKDIIRGKTVNNPVNNSFNNYAQELIKYFKYLDTQDILQQEYADLKEKKPIKIDDDFNLSEKNQIITKETKKQIKTIADYIPITVRTKKKKKINYPKKRVIDIKNPKFRIKGLEKEKSKQIICPEKEKDVHKNTKIKVEAKVPIKNKLKNKPGAKTKLKNNTKNKPGVKKDLVSEILGNM